MATYDSIKRLFEQYMGFSPSSQDVRKFSLMSPVEVEDILKGTKSDVISGATKTAKDELAGLTAGLDTSTADYVSTMAKGKRLLEEQYGLPQAEQTLASTQKFYSDIATKGPMFEQTMKGGLQAESPTDLPYQSREVDRHR